MTYGNVLATVDAVQLDRILSAFFGRWEAQTRCGEEPSRVVTPGGQADQSQLASDGKALRATSKHVHPVHQLSCYEVTTGRVLWHCTVQEKHNASRELKPFLTTEVVNGRLLSVHALQTHRALCAQVHRLQGDSLLIAKDHQPTLREDSAAFFEDPHPDRRRWQEAETGDPRAWATGTSADAMQP